MSSSATARPTPAAAGDGRSAASTLVSGSSAVVAVKYRRERSMVGYLILSSTITHRGASNATDGWFAHLLWTSERPCDPVFHRDVGALHVLRDARPAGAVPGRCGRQRRLRSRRPDR